MAFLLRYAVMTNVILATAVRQQADASAQIVIRLVRIVPAPVVVLAVRGRGVIVPRYQRKPVLGLIMNVRVPVSQRGPG